MSTQHRHHDPHASDYDEIARESAALEQAIRRETPRLEALCEAMADRERDLWQGGRVIQAGELFVLLEHLRPGLGHACYEITPGQDASLRRAWGLVGTDREQAS